MSNQNHQKRIYLACPYSDPDLAIRERRFQAANQAAAWIMNQGWHLVFSPISHSHPMAVQCDLPGGSAYWQSWNLSFILRWADEIWVLAIDGFRESVGVAMETAFANMLGIPVKFLTPLRGDGYRVDDTL